MTGRRKEHLAIILDCGYSGRHLSLVYFLPTGQSVSRRRFRRVIDGFALTLFLLSIVDDKLLIQSNAWSSSNFVSTVDFDYSSKEIRSFQHHCSITTHSSSNQPSNTSIECLVHDPIGDSQYRSCHSGISSATFERSCRIHSHGATKSFRSDWRTNSASTTTDARWSSPVYAKQSPESSSEYDESDEYISWSQYTFESSERRWVLNDRRHSLLPKNVLSM